MRSGTGAPPVAPRPVADVVPTALVRCAGPVAHLVPLHPRGGEDRIGHLVLARLVIVVGHRDLAATNLPGQAGALLDDQRVGRQVVGRQLKRRVERAPPIGHALPRRAVDEIEADGHPRCADRRDGARHGGGVVGAVEGREHVRHGRLHPQAHPGEPRRGEGRHPLRRHGVGVRLGRHLGIGREPPPIPYAVQHLREVGGRQEGGCATTDEHGLDLARAWPAAAVGEDVDGQVQFPQHLVGIAADLGRSVGTQLRDRVGVEIAVATAHAAEGDVDVDAERRGRDRVESAGREATRSGGGVPVGEGGRHTRILSARAVESCAVETRAGRIMRGSNRGRESCASGPRRRCGGVSHRHAVGPAKAFRSLAQPLVNRR